MKNSLNILNAASTMLGTIGRLSPLPSMPLAVVNQTTPQQLIAELDRRRNAGRLAAARLIEEKAARDKKLLHETLSEDAVFSLTYVPYVIAEVVWDFVDSILNVAALMRLSATKPLCRKLKELRRDYDRERYKIINDAWRNSETDNMIMFQETLSDYFNKLHRYVVDELTERYGKIEDNTQYLISAVYCCRVVLKALNRYCNVQEKIVSNILGYSIAGTILPEELKTLGRLVMEFAGDTTLDESKFAKKEIEFVEELARYISETELNDTDKPNEHHPKSMTMEEMKSLVAEINATLSEFQKNLELNVEKGNKAAGARARKASLKLEKLMKTYRKNSVKQPNV